MNHTSLEIFTVVAEELSIIKAATRLGRVQSNITTRIQQLEQELGVQLFSRENRRLALTSQGRKFLCYAQRILSLAQEARQSLHPQQPSGTLALGAMECAAASRLSMPLSHFRQACPQVRLTLATLPTRQLTEKVYNAQLDCALVALPEGRDGNVICPDGLSSQPLFVEQMTLVLPVGFDQAKSGNDAGALKLAAFRQGCRYRELAIGLMARRLPANQQPAVQEVGSYHAMLACVAAGNYLCLLPASVLELLQLPAGVTLVAAGSATTHFIWRADARSPALDSLRRALAATSNVER